MSSVASKLYEATLILDDRFRDDYQTRLNKANAEIAELVADEAGEQSKYLFQTGEDFEVLTPNEAYAKFGQRGYHGMPKFKAVGEQILELDGAEYKELRVCDTQEDAEILLGSWVEEDDSNVLFYESPEKAERCLREAYEGDTELAQMLDKLAEAVKNLEKAK